MFKEAILPGLSHPEDLSNLDYSELSVLAGEIRRQIVSSVSRNGGHLASNLGVVELTIALHRVFRSPEDKIVWDVGHQCYAHKMVTGRAGQFESLRRRGGLSGFPKRAESPHDAFDTGHASTSISVALGFLVGGKILGREGRAVAVIGDGALTGGLAYEGLSHAGQLGLPLVVVLNDNKMSIGPNVGALSKYLSRLTMKSRYQMFRRKVDRLIKRIPGLGPYLYEGVVRMKRGIKAVFYPENFFVDLGFEYVGPIEGHQLPVLEQVLSDVRKLERPVVVHVITRKGKGYHHAEHDPSTFHGVTPFSVSDGLVETRGPGSFTEAFGSAMVELGNTDGRVVALTAAMEKGTGLAAFRAFHGDRFYDVGIAEQHQITFAAGLAAQGLRPVAAVYSTFIQRSVDQVIHDVALQNLPVTVCLDRAGFVGDDGETHQGLFDIALFRSVPNLEILSPATAAELSAMLSYGVSGPGPVVIRYPKAPCPYEAACFAAPLERGRGVFVRDGRSTVCLAFTGGLYPQAAEAADILTASGLAVDLYNLRFLKPVDEEYLLDLMNSYVLMVFIEEGIRSGGFGEYALSLASRRGVRNTVVALGAETAFLPQASRQELLAASGLDGPGIAASTEIAYRRGRGMSVVKAVAQ